MLLIILWGCWKVTPHHSAALQKVWRILILHTDGIGVCIGYTDLLDYTNTWRLNTQHTPCKSGHVDWRLEDDNLVLKVFPLPLGTDGFYRLATSVLCLPAWFGPRRLDSSLMCALKSQLLCCLPQIQPGSFRWKFFRSGPRLQNLIRNLKFVPYDLNK